MGEKPILTSECRMVGVGTLTVSGEAIEYCTYLVDASDIEYLLYTCIRRAALTVLLSHK